MNTMSAKPFPRKKHLKYKRDVCHADPDSYREKHLCAVVIRHPALHCTLAFFNPETFHFIKGCTVKRMIPVRCFFKYLFYEKYPLEAIRPIILHSRISIRY